MERPVNWAGLAKGWLVLGLIGLAFVAVMDIGHFVYAMPVYYTHARRDATDAEIRQFSFILGSGFGLFALAGALIHLKFRQKPL